jgi:hypothetical protein
MEIEIVLELDDYDEDVDLDDHTGLSESGYNRLMDALMGYTIAEGPTQR